MPAKKWPPPGFPIVQGDHALTDMWNVHLPAPFARRIEDDSLVLWRPGLTIWLAPWLNNHNQTQSKRLATIKGMVSPEGYDARESVHGGVTHFSYRLRDDNENGPIESLNAWAISDNEQLQMSIYFDDPTDATVAQQIVDSISIRSQA